MTNNAINTQIISVKPTVRKCFVCCKSLDAVPKRKRVAKINTVTPCKSVSTPLYIPKAKETLGKEDLIKRPRDNAKKQKALPSGEFTATNKVLGY